MHQLATANWQRGKLSPANPRSSPSRLANHRPPISDITGQKRRINQSNLQVSPNSKPPASPSSPKPRHFPSFSPQNSFIEEVFFSTSESLFFSPTHSNHASGHAICGLNGPPRCVKFSKTTSNIPIRSLDHSALRVTNADFN